MNSISEMRTIEAQDNKFIIPDEFELSLNKRKLHIKTPWAIKIVRLCKDDITVSTQVFFRHKSRGDKPYIPEGFIEIDGERFKIMNSPGDAN